MAAPAMVLVEPMPLPTLLPAAPEALLDAQTGRPAFGRFRGAIADTATRHWDGAGGLFSARRTRRKSWLYLGAFSPQFMVGFAIVDAGLLGTAFVYVYDRKNRKLTEDKVSVPLGFARTFAPRLRDEWELAKGSRRWRVRADGEGWRGTFSSPRLQVTLDLVPETEGMTTVAASPGRPFNSTFKDCSLRGRISVSIDGELAVADATGMVDFTLGYPPRRTFWNWTALSGETTDGRKFGLNLVAHFNNGLENAMWVDGGLQPLAQASFGYDPARLELPWRLTTADGIVNLRFEPEGQRSENVNALVMGSRFVQAFGRFEGTIRTAGRTLPVFGFGVTEEHWATW